MKFFDSKTIEKKEERVSPAVAAAISDDSEAIRKLCREILIMIPYRTTEGIHPILSQHAIHWVNSGMGLTFFRDPFGGFIEITRNTMAKEFLARRDKRYLLMIDNDVVPQMVEAPLLLARHSLPIVSGVACAFRPGEGVVACFTAKDKNGTARWPSLRDTKKMPAVGVAEVEGAGTGCMMIRRDVLESIWTKEAPFTIPESIRIEASGTNIARKTEDIAFCDKAKAAGFKIYVDFEVQCFHEKMLPLAWGAENLDPNLRPEDWDVTPFAPSAEV